MQVGDRVLLKPTSQLRATLGSAASTVGIVSGVVGLKITVDFPDLPLYTRLLPAADFSRFSDQAADPAQADQWQKLVTLVEAGPTPQRRADDDGAAGPADELYPVVALASDPARPVAPQFGRTPNAVKAQR